MSESLVQIGVRWDEEKREDGRGYHRGMWEIKCAAGVSLGKITTHQSRWLTTTEVCFSLCCLAGVGQLWFCSSFVFILGPTEA